MKGMELMGREKTSFTRLFIVFYKNCPWKKKMFWGKKKDEMLVFEEFANLALKNLRKARARKPSSETYVTRRGGQSSGGYF